jgi:aminopeptidase N
VWPMRVQLLVQSDDGAQVVPVELRGRRVSVPSLLGLPPPQFMFANYGDYGYGRFAIDAQSLPALAEAAINKDDPLSRGLLWSALWDSVRDAAMPPRQFIEYALQAIPVEADELNALSLLMRTQVAYRWYLSAPDRDALTEPIERMLVEGMQRARTQGLRITFLRTLMMAGSGRLARDTMRRLLAGELTIPEVDLSSRDRFRMIARLVSIGEPDALVLLRAQADTDRTDDGARFAYAAAAAEASVPVKDAYFDAFLGSAALAESWIEEALAPFNTVEHAALTLPYLKRALATLPSLKRERKIFFVNGWLAAFIGGQTSEAALATVNDFLARTKLDADLRLKVLEAVDDLQRTVAVRRRYGS